VCVEDRAECSESLHRWCPSVSEVCCVWFQRHQRRTAWILSAKEGLLVGRLVHLQ